MKKIFIISCIVFLASCSSNVKKEGIIKYPVTKKTDTVDTYFGVKIPDSYRWLENDTTKETAKWVEEENKVTFDYLAKIPFRNEIKKRLTQLWNYEKCGVPFKKGKYYFFNKNNGLQNQSVFYVQEGLSGTPAVLIDPNELSVDGTIAISGTNPSEDARYLAYNLSKAGSDWSTIQVMNVQTKEVMEDHLNWIKFSGVSWKGNGFYYSCYDKPEEGKELSGKNEYNKVYYHALGEMQEKDELIYEDKEHPLRSFGAYVTESEKFLVLITTESTSGNSLKVKDLAANTNSFKTIVDNFENDYSIVDNINNDLLVLTNYKAPKYQLVLIDPDKPQPQNWKVIIPESADLLEGVSLCNNKLVITYQHDVSSRSYVYSMQGQKEQEIQLPGIGSVGGFSSEKKDSLAFYSYTNFTTPGTIYKYNSITNTSEIFFKPKMDFNPDGYETKQVFYNSKDGTKIPMFITHKKGLQMDGTNPTFLYGYGGFNISITPDFRVERAVFLENGGVYTVANIRGGGEYGEDWHKAGTLCNKQNVFDDFIAAAEYLVKEKYTSHNKLAIHGRSNGGLLIGAVITQRPDLAKVALPTVGVLDMLRYHKFTIGWAWATDYGTSDNKEQFDCLLKYSPLHNVKEVEYPATLIMTADHDDRVVPAHSFKFAATMQEKNKGTDPVLIRIDSKAGHGSGKPVTKQIEEFADMWSFVFYNLGITPVIAKTAEAK